MIVINFEEYLIYFVPSRTTVVDNSSRQHGGNLLIVCDQSRASAVDRHIQRIKNNLMNIYK